MRFALALMLFAFPLHAQWDIQDSGTTADLRGIVSVGKGIAWASGTNGTVIRTEDAGYLWQHCTTPPGAENLDFRGIQAFDANTAIVMSSGKGKLSRLYKTTDGCQTWKLLATNPDKDGFWDAIVFQDRNRGALLGDPVNGAYYLVQTTDGGLHWAQIQNKAIAADSKVQGAFAASNSSILYQGGKLYFGSGGIGGANLYIANTASITGVPLGNKTESSGIFSLATSSRPSDRNIIIAVGGDYQKPDDISGTSAFTTDGSKHWQAAITSPHGYRSSVAYDEASETWLTVGPNGTDISTDHGRDWRALKPGPGDQPDADQHWNALSLPFAVGPKGRIGTLQLDRLKPAKATTK